MDIFWNCTVQEMLSLIFLIPVTFELNLSSWTLLDKIDTCLKFLAANSKYTDTSLKWTLNSGSSVSELKRFHFLVYKCGSGTIISHWHCTSTSTSFHFSRITESILTWKAIHCEKKIWVRQISPWKMCECHSYFHLRELWLLFKLLLSFDVLFLN